jgi:hypothetical protein
MVCHNGMSSWYVIMVEPLDYVTDGKNPDLHRLVQRIADDVDTLIFEMNTSGCNLKPVTQVFFELDV